MLVLDEKSALRFALARVCAVCRRPNGFPLVLAGPRAGAKLFDCPPLHAACAAQVVPPGWAVVATGSFTIERPRHRGAGQRVRFRAGTPIPD